MARVKKGACKRSTPQPGQPQDGAPAGGDVALAAAAHAGTSASGAGSLVSSGRFAKGLPERRASGTEGRPVALTVNMFRLVLGKDQALVHYEVTFHTDRPAEANNNQVSKRGAGNGGGGGRGAGSGGQKDRSELPDRSMRMAAFHHMVRLFSGPGQDFHKRRLVFDGRKNMYSVSQRLEQEENVLHFSCCVEEGEQEQALRANYKLASVQGTGQAHVLDLSDGSQEAVQGLNVLMSYPISRQMVQTGYRFFCPGGESLGMNLSLLMGFRQSVRPCVDGLFVNVDRAAALFQDGGNLADIFCKILNADRRNVTPQNFSMSPEIKFRLERELKGLKVKAVIKGASFNRTYKIASFTMHRVDAPQLAFFWEEQNRTVTIPDYYRMRYGLVLRFLNLPCIRVSSNNIPIEVCHLMPNQYYDKKMTSAIQALVTRRTIELPDKRFAGIEKSIDKIRSLVSGITDCDISAEAAQVTGRILPPPAIQFGSGIVQVVEKPDGSCDYDGGRGGKFVNTKPVNRWVVVQITRTPAARDIHPFLKDFCSKLSAKARDRGWNLASGFQAKTFQYTGKPALKQYMAMAKEKGKLDLMLFAMPVEDNMYNDIKSCSNEVGIVAQCLNFDVNNAFDMDPGRPGSQAKKMGGQFIENMLKKMNAKVGGVNSVLADKSLPAFLRNNDVMFVGMDVYHPPAFSPDVNSLVGIVGSYDRNFCQYFHQAMAQPQVDPNNKKRVEEIRTAVRIVLKDFFIRYKGKNGKYPNAVIVMRDGVSEGQFQRVKDIEVAQILDAMAELGFADKARITFMTVQKRHSFRMFARVDGRIGNPRPGTVVDTSVVHAAHNDYYLSSHHALKGTAKPSHYTLIHDEADLSNNQMQGMSYALSYLSARCDKPISLPVPVNYAHLVAERASKLLESAQREAGGGLSAAQVNEAIRIRDGTMDRLDYV